MTLKPSAFEILQYLRSERGWVSTLQILRRCATVTPSKRLSELHQQGLIDKMRDPEDPRYMCYRARREQ